ncbi:LPXTG cell wall anchor domain-containing protein [Streptomyces sp. NPDC056452]|uniref:LPXTG cell wall anchor domain-containing protein n=1 Tax=Streptomyces sp. NPDC056452 TaxID=3345821 RepID=UPI00369E403F
MSPRSTLRTAVLTAVATGAVLVPSTAAVADDATPKPVPTAAERTATPSPAPEAAEPSAAPAPAEKSRSRVTPRGGVAAGERAATETGGGSTALYGSAAGAVLLAGAGTFVLRRRSAAHRNG